MLQFPLPRLYAIVDVETAVDRGWDPAALARAYLAGGARLLQLRAKRLGSGAFLDLARAVAASASAKGGIVLVNDRADVARLAGAGGVHVGQEDLAPADVRAITGPDAIVGLSTHSIDQLCLALTQPVDYVAIGPVFSTATKDTRYAEVGLGMVRRAAEARGGRPLVAIGGITLERAAEVIAAGAASVAVIADLVATGDPEARVRQYLRALGEVAAG